MITLSLKKSIESFTSRFKSFSIILDHIFLNAFTMLAPNRIFVILLITSLFASTKSIKSQVNYLTGQPKEVIENLEKWKDLKFGILMHWGLYSQIGVVESWGLCSEDQSFQDRGDFSYDGYKKMYSNLLTEFNPQGFDPNMWADAAQRAGMKYMVFTTKHHDGFCMFDSHQTDYKITSQLSPFHDHPMANVAKHVFQSFRERGFMIGAYFSKPDWKSEFYWSPKWATPNRNNNYDVRKYPDLWKGFKDYTFNQIMELTSGEYGKIDILWLDGGWVRPDSTINEEVKSWGYDIPRWEQDIDIPRIAKMARSYNPAMLMVDRTVHGPFENYRTPEQSVPDRIYDYPWESNMTMTQSWGHTFNPVYKTTDFLIHTLVDVVSKGGNFLLNVAPTPDGMFEPKAIQTLDEIGQWMQKNGQAIYHTRPFKKFGEGENIRFTMAKDGSAIYIFVQGHPGESLILESLVGFNPKSITHLASGEKIKFNIEKGKMALKFSKKLKDEMLKAPEKTHVFKLQIK